MAYLIAQDQHESRGFDLITVCYISIALSHACSSVSISVLLSPTSSTYVCVDLDHVPALTSSLVVYKALSITVQRFTNLQISRLIYCLQVSRILATQEESEWHEVLPREWSHLGIGNLTFHSQGITCNFVVILIVWYNALRMLGFVITTRLEFLSSGTLCDQKLKSTR